MAQSTEDLNNLTDQLTEGEDYLAGYKVTVFKLINPDDKDAVRVPCPWSQDKEHPVFENADKEPQGDAPVCTRCPYFLDIARASMGGSKDDPTWEGVFCQYGS